MGKITEMFLVKNLLVSSKVTFLLASGFFFGIFLYYASGWGENFAPEIFLSGYVVFIFSLAMYFSLLSFAFISKKMNKIVASIASIVIFLLILCFLYPIF